MNVFRSYYLSTRLLMVITLISLSIGCELVTEFDRSKLLDASEESDTSIAEFDTSTPPEDAAKPDAEVDGGIIDGSMTDTGIVCTSPADCTDPENDCQVATCTEGSCGIADKALGEACDLDGGVGVCNGEGLCVPIGCTNGVLDDDETDVDCGGQCPGCDNGEACITYRDCKSAFCQGGLDPDQDAGTVESPPGECAACSDDDDCDAMDDSYCDTDEADGTCKAKKANGSECDDDNECLSESCKEDYDGEGSWCADEDECMHDGDAYDDSDVSPDCYNSTSRAICDEGDWDDDACGDEPAQDSDSGNNDYTSAGTVTVYSACVDGACGTTQYEDSCDDNVLTEYGVDGVSEVSTEYDCEALETTECDGNNEITHEWICDGDPGRCVEDTDTSRGCGTTACSGTCASEGCTYVVRGCASDECYETPHDPDDLDTYCTGCSLTWLANGTGTGSNCCGDDLGEDFEQEAAADRSCCYNAAVLTSGSSSGSILCYNGQLYECNTSTSADWDDRTTCQEAEAGSDLYCTSSNTWDADNIGCSCTNNPDCTTGYCRWDWDDDEEFCAQDATSCVYDDGSDVHQRDDGWVECDEGDTYRECDDGSWNASESCDAATCDSGCGYISDNDNACVTGQGLGVAGGCEFEDGVGTTTCNDCGDLTATAGACNTGVSACSTACGSSLCNGAATVDTDINVCHADGDSYNRIDACSVTGTGEDADCINTDDGDTNDTLNQDCPGDDCSGGECP